MPTDPHQLPAETVAALTLWAEARGDNLSGHDPHLGYTYVLAVLLNRAYWGLDHMRRWHGTPHPEFGDGTLKDACLRPLQFSCWNTGGGSQRSRMLLLAYTVSARDADFYLAANYVLAAMAAGGVVPDPTMGSTHYLTKAAWASAPRSHWSHSSQMTHTVDSPKQAFFRQAGLSENPRGWAPQPTT